jgi:tetratricopeptide (TPR) repeat protein
VRPRASTRIPRLGRAIAIAVALCLLGAAAHARSEPPLPAPDDAPTLQELAQAAAEDFRAGRFAEAAEGYEAARERTTSARDRATIELNLGACLFEMGRFAEAKRAFLRAAELDSTVADRAHLNAAAAALRLGRLEEARSLAESALAGAPELASRRSSLLDEIASAEGDARRDAERQSFVAHVRAAEKALRASDATTAERELVSASAHFEVASPEERVDVQHGLAVSRLERGDAAGAKQILVNALVDAPNDSDLHHALGRAELALGNEPVASVELERALELGLDEERAKAARTLLRDIDPLPPSRFYGWLTLGAGYDTNPWQSGAGKVLPLGNRGQGGAEYGIVSVGIGRQERLSDRWAADIGYAGDWIGFWRRAVEDLTIQAHSLTAALDWSAAPRLVLGLSAGPSFTFVGLSPVEPFSWDILIGAHADLTFSAVRALRASLDFRSITGFEGWEFLGGNRLDARVVHDWSWRRASLRLGAVGRYNGIGTRVSSVDATVIPACAGLCDGADYLVPLGYASGGPLVSASLKPVDWLRLRGYAALELRQYLDDSRIVGVGASRKTRADTRWTGTLRGEFQLDSGGHVRVAPSYTLIANESNVSYDASDPEHQFDYDDRSFVQHLLELDLEMSF